ncbi:periplasmic heavy metal sensor [Fertoebacter nigrum]|uniref:Periplasmic heavy metal sensor n=1 Tax=Fertoeibacter niger TaxID=2656921 RepID=A0A8X8H9S7_9RHOB|nr:periplasmic heavy metal sensor [Fertoeibacter niger]NUB46306.1 periplasmic heavy metal sensor [Fertoeibacter niger]
MTEPHTPAARPAAPRWMRLALALSVALNLGVAGVVGGSLLHDARKEPRPVPVRDLGFGPFSEALSPEDRAALRRAFMAEAPDFRDAWRQMRGEFGAVLDALRAEPFEPAALAVVLDRQSVRTGEMLSLGQRLLFDRVAEMTPEARLAFADRLEQSLSRRPTRRGGEDRKP